MKRFLFISFLCLYLPAPAQTPRDLEYEIESVAEGNEENETDLIQLAESLQQLKNHPVRINFATEDDLNKIPYLNIFQIHNLLQYRHRSGMIYSPYELTAVKGFNRETITKILPYLSFATRRRTPVIKPKYLWLYSRHKFLARSAIELYKREGYKKENGYLGAPAGYYFRYRGSYSDLLSVGFTAQQDAGEPFDHKYQKYGIDFISGNIAVEGYGNLRSLVLGDYQAEFGQGMALWSSLAFGKSAEAVEIKRYARGFRPFSGAEENRFFRGVAATYRFMNALDISSFYSNKHIDANVSATDSNATPAFVSSLQLTGLHRTGNELADKNVNRLQVWGGNINYKGKGFSIGATAANYRLATPLEAGKQLYQKFRFSGTELTNLSVDFNYLYRNINLFGELARSDNGALAGNIGFQSNPADPLYFTILYRRLEKRYQFLYNAPFAESGNYGESGTYFGIQWEISRIFQLKSYLDIYKFDWLRFRLNAPSYGRDLLGQLEMYFNRWFTAYIRLKNEVRQVNSDSETTHPALTGETKTSLRFHTAYQANRQFRLASRLEISRYTIESKTEKGFMVFQDVRYHLQNFPLTLTLRYAIIDTKSFKTRIYAYENDLTYAFSIPPYYGQSNRFYILADWDISDRFIFQVKYAVTTFTDRTEIGSGLARIAGNKQSQVKLQVRIKL